MFTGSALGCGRQGELVLGPKGSWTLGQNLVLAQEPREASCSHGRGLISAVTARVALTHHLDTLVVADTFSLAQVMSAGAETSCALDSPPTS